MLSLRNTWRHPSILFAIIAVLAMLAYDGAFVNRDNFEGYWTSTFSAASIFLIFSAPVGSASAAILAARARRSGIWSSPLVRSRASITAGLVVPSFVAALAAQIVGLLLLAADSWGAPGRVPIEIPLAWAAILAFHVAIGYLFGRFLPIAASIPLAIFASYCWLGFTWTVDYFPIRYLSGLIISSCCSTETTLDDRAVIAVIIFSVLMCAACFLLATVPPVGVHWSVKPGAVLAAIVCVALAFSSGLNIARTLPAQPVIARSSSDLICSGTAPRICIYPEQLQQGDPRPVIKKAYENLEHARIPLPSKATTSNTSKDRGSLRLVIPVRWSTSQIVYTTAIALIPDDVAPYCGDGSDLNQRLDVAAVSSWWLQSVAGHGLLDGSPPPSTLSPDASQLIQRFKSVPFAEQRSWYLTASPTLTKCSVTPISVPGT